MPAASPAERDRGATPPSSREHSSTSTNSPAGTRPSPPGRRKNRDSASACAPRSRRVSAPAVSTALTSPDAPMGIFASRFAALIISVAAHIFVPSASSAISVIALSSASIAATTVYGRHVVLGSDVHGLRLGRALQASVAVATATIDARSLWVLLSASAEHGPAVGLFALVCYAFALVVMAATQRRVPVAA